MKHVTFLIFGLFFLLSTINRLDGQSDFVRDTTFRPKACVKVVENMIEGEDGALYHVGAGHGHCNIDPGDTLIAQQGLLKLRMENGSFNPFFKSSLPGGASELARMFLTYEDSLLYLHLNFGGNGLVGIRSNGDYTDTVPIKLIDINDSTMYKSDWFNKYYSGTGNFIKLDDGSYLINGALAVKVFDQLPPTTAHVLKFTNLKIPDDTFIPGFVTFQSGTIVPAVRRTMTQGDKIIITGYFDSYNGYFSPGIVRIDQSGKVDSSFKSPFQRCEVVNLSKDKQGRFLMSGGGTIVNEQDTVYTSFWRLKPDGSVDSTFNYKHNIGLYHISLDTNTYANGVYTGCEWVELQNGYLIFTHGVYNDEEIRGTYQGIKKSLMVLDDNGYLLPQYFQVSDFLGVTVGLCNASQIPGLIPNEFYQVTSIIEARDGRIFVGGYYCGYNGEYTAGSIMAFFPPAALLSNSFKPSPLSSDIVLAYPNPVNDYLQIEAIESRNIRPDLVLIDATGRVLINLAQVALPYRFDLSGYVPGMYYLQVKESKQCQVLKVVVSRH